MKTTNYEQFKVLKQNRPVAISHVNKLMDSIKKYGYYNSKPITVNSKFEVIDGQHRLIACRELRVPILYEIDDVPVNESMVTLNSTSNVWRLGEYINHHAENGIFCYIELRNLINQSGFGVSNCIYIYFGNPFGLTKKLKAGVNLKKTTYITEMIELIDYFKGKISFYLTSTFVKSIGIIFSHTKATPIQIERLKLNAFSIVQCATTDQYTIQFNKIRKIKNLTK